MATTRDITIHLTFEEALAIEVVAERVDHDVTYDIYCALSSALNEFIGALDSDVEWEDSIPAAVLNDFVVCIDDE